MARILLPQAGAQGKGQGLLFRWPDAAEREAFLPHDADVTQFGRVLPLPMSLHAPERREQ